MEVPLRDVVLPRLEPVETPRQENTLALTASLWLDDEGLCLPVIELILEVFHVSLQQPRLRKEIEILREVLLHRYQVLCQ